MSEQLSFKLTFPTLDRKNQRPLREALAWTGGEMWDCEFGHLIGVFLALENQNSSNHELVLAKGFEGRGGNILAKEQDRVIKYISRWLDPDSQMKQFGSSTNRFSATRFQDNVLQESLPMDPVDLDITETLLASVQLYPSIAMKMGALSLSERLNRLGNRVKRIGAYHKSVVAVQKGTSEWSTFQWGYGSSDLIALVWLEVFLCVQHDLYCRKCDLCKRYFVDFTSRTRGCHNCRAQSHYGAVRQKERRMVLPAATRGSVNSRHRDQMDLRRGKLTAVEFILRHPSYKPRKGSHLYGVLLGAAKEMVELGTINRDQFTQMFPGIKPPSE